MISRSLPDLASYVKQELVTCLQKTRFALQMDESTDVAGLAILLVILVNCMTSRGCEIKGPARALSVVAPGLLTVGAYESLLRVPCTTVSPVAGQPIADGRAHSVV
ncbi:hypothetical protein EVAR_43624_1 [Eumeta japonica]|uniref:Zinc finger BED domain-containing protein 5 n=1 Tax=Eumeta variegata TaxID=151549 RepID=A0A4C1XCW5_EUMVA|nr:hypothetical protein EVAR_43624_1 [Eumeta japonica]